MAFIASARHSFWHAGAKIDEATDLQSAKDAVVRGSGASRPWMACARLLEPGTAQSGDAPDPRITAAPAEASETGALLPHCRGSPRSRQTPALFKLAESGIPRLSEEPSKNAFGDLPGDAIDRLPNAMVGPRAAWCRFRWPRPHAHNRRSIRPRRPSDRREHPGWRAPARPASIRFATPFATGATQARNRGVALRWIPPGNCGGGCPPC